MLYLFADNICWYCYLWLWFWFWYNRRKEHRFLYFLCFRQHFFVFSINIFAMTLVVIHITKYEHLWLLHIVIWYRSYREHPYFSIVSILTKLPINIWLAHKLYPSTVDIFSSIYNLKQMNINSIKIRLCQCSILCPMDILIT